jgi:hypothetical protein
VRHAREAKVRAVAAHVRAVVGGLTDPGWAGLGDHEEWLRRVAAELPPAVWHKLQKAVATRYSQLEGRYGRSTALAIVSVGILATPLPVPGSALLAVAPLIVLAELHHRLTAVPEPPAEELLTRTTLTEAERHHLGQKCVQELATLLKHA